MKILGLEIRRVEKQQLTSISDYRGGWRRILESFPGAWQMNVEEKHGTLLCYPALYACLASISQDIGKLPFQLMSPTADGNFIEIQNPAYSPVLQRPNRYQN